MALGAAGLMLRKRDHGGDHDPYFRALQTALAGAGIAQRFGFNILWGIVAGLCVVAALGYRRMRQIKIPVYE